MKTTFRSEQELPCGSCLHTKRRAGICVLQIGIPPGSPSPKHPNNENCATGRDLFMPVVTRVDRDTVETGVRLLLTGKMVMIIPMTAPKTKVNDIHIKVSTSPPPFRAPAADSTGARSAACPRFKSCRDCHAPKRSLLQSGRDGDPTAQKQSRRHLWLKPRSRRRSLIFCKA